MGLPTPSRLGPWSEPPEVSQCCLWSPGVYLAPSPAAANDNILDDMGLMALTPLGDMLNSPQPDALNILLAGPASLPLTSPLDGSLCMPSTGTMTPSSPLAGHMMTPPGGTPPSPMPGPISVGSPLLNATVTPSLLTVGNLVLPEVPRLRLAESPGAPHASVPAGPTLVSKGNCKRGTVGGGLRTLLTDVLARRKGPAPQTTRKPLRILPLERPPHPPPGSYWTYSSH